MNFWPTMQKMLSPDEAAKSASTARCRARRVGIEAAAGGRADHHSDAQRGVVPGHHVAGDDRPPVLRCRGAGGGPQRAARRFSPATRPGEERTYAQRPALGRHGRPGSALHHRFRRRAPSGDPGTVALPGAGIPRRLAVHGGTSVDRRAGGRSQSRARGAFHAAEGARGRGHPVAAERPGRTRGRGAVHELARTIGRHGGQPAGCEERREAGGARNLRPQRRAWTGCWSCWASASRC